MSKELARVASDEGATPEDQHTAIVALSVQRLIEDMFPWVDAGYITAITDTSMEIHPDTPKEAYEAIGKTLTVEEALHKSALSTIQWLRGDWLRFGEWKWGEKYAQATETWNRAERTLQNNQWVADKFEPERRRPWPISFGHHSAVASLPPVDQDNLLDRAVKEDLQREDLRAEKRKLKDMAQGLDPDVEEARRAMVKAVDALKDANVDMWPALVVGMLDDLRKRYPAAAVQVAERVATWATFTKGER